LKILIIGKLYQTFLFLFFFCRNRKRQKSKSLVRNSVNKRQTTIKVRANNNTLRTRRLRSSSSTDISTSAIVSPVTNDENNDEESFSLKKLDNDRQEVYKLRSKQTEKIEFNQKDLSDSSKESDQEEVEDKQIDIEKPKLDESIREFLWQPTKMLTTTTITEVTDQNGVTVLIRELNDIPTSNITRTPRFLGYGNGGRGGKH
jgi:hypothetical protein